MGILLKKYAGLLRRRKLFSLGIFYFNSSKIKIPKFLNINGRYKEFKFLDRNEPNFFYEFHEICVNDCYHLKNLKRIEKNLQTIVDIGANQSLFSIAARRNFPHANLFGYEPNKKLEPILTFNSKQLNAKVYYEAVTKEDCMVQLKFGETALNTQTRLSTEGDVTGTSLKKVIERAGGTIDILKIDCEGAEWDLFEDETSWKSVKALTMEYHSWAKPGSRFDDIKSILEKLKFKILFHNPCTEGFGIITAIQTEWKGL